jgi:Glyoxalase-like domain
VLLPVADLEEGAGRLRERYGLQAIAGGRHAGVGTANMIVPLGRQYVELITVADPLEASRSRLGRAVRRALAEGRTLMAWALRTRDLDALRAKLLAAGWDLPAVSEGLRGRLDGQVLRWRTQDTSRGEEATALPFVIEWDSPQGLHPGEGAVAQHHVPTVMRRVVVGTSVPGRVRELLASPDGAVVIA